MRPRAADITIREAVTLLPGARLALSIGEAREALGVSADFWLEHIAPELKIVRVGRRKLVAVSELQRWLDEHGDRVSDHLSAAS